MQFLPILMCRERLKSFAWIFTLVGGSFFPLAKGANDSPLVGIKFSPPTGSPHAQQVLHCLEQKEALTDLIQPLCEDKRADIDSNIVGINWDAEPTGSVTTAGGEERPFKEETSNFTKGQVENIDNYAKNWDQVTPRRLAEDARAIHQALVIQNKRRAAACTTILCAAIMDPDKKIKKFVSCNHMLLPPDLRKESEYLGYHVIRAGRSHAEGEFLQFLWKRSKQHTPAYTHIIGMGCSRKHCKECDLLMQLVLGRDYHRITAAADEGGQVFEGRAAVDTDKTYDHYYVSEALQKVIECYTNTQLTRQGRFLSPSRKKKASSSSRTESAAVRRNPMRTCREDAERKKRQRLDR